MQEWTKDKYIALLHGKTVIVSCVGSCIKLCLVEGGHSVMHSESYQATHEEADT